MPDHTTAPVTVNRFEGVLDGTPAAAARFVERVLALPHVEGPVELPSGRMVATYDPEYLDWFFATAWGTTKKAAAWLGVPEQLFLIACNVAAAGFHTAHTWQVHALAAALLEQGHDQSTETRASVRSGVARLLDLTAEDGWHAVAQLSIRKALRRVRPTNQSGEAYTFVYFLRSSGRVKIGRSSNPKRRGAGIAAQAGARMTLEAAIPARFEDEFLAHAIFAATRKSGEWFAPSPELKALVLLAKKDPAAALRVIRMPPAAALAFLADIAAPQPTQLALVANMNATKRTG